MNLAFDEVFEDLLCQLQKSKLIVVMALICQLQILQGKRG